MENKVKNKTKIKKIVTPKIQVKKESVKEEVVPPKKEVKKDFWGNLGNFVKKSIDCCLE